MSNDGGPHHFFTRDRNTQRIMVMQSGFDAPFDIRPFLTQIMAHGASWAGRYYSHNAAKNLSRAEAEACAKKGLACVAVWEVWAAERHSDVVRFSEASGREHAEAAMALAVECGQPAGSPIYFAVDGDVDGGDIIGYIAPYFRGINAVLAGKFAVGVYGSGFTLSTLRTNKFATFFWLACAGGWRGTKEFTGWHIHQHLPKDLFGIGNMVDPDDGVDGNFGQWKPLLIPQLVTVPKAAEPWNDVAAVQRRLVAWGADIGVDGIRGDETVGAIEDFQGDHALKVDGVVGPATWQELVKEPG